MSDESEWHGNYFNYFTEIEEHFQRARATGLFLLSPLDWALIENWKNAGIPLEAVLKGIDDAFEKWHARKIKRRLVNSLAYCAQAVLEAARNAPVTDRAAVQSEAPFAPDELSAHLRKNAAIYSNHPDAALREVGATLESLSLAWQPSGARSTQSRNRQAPARALPGDYLGEAGREPPSLEDLERRLTALEDKVVAILRSAQSDEDLYSIRQSLDRELKPYRGKMTADQLAMLERRYLDSALLERAKLPRLSLFYLH